MAEFLRDPAFRLPFVGFWDGLTEELRSRPLDRPDGLREREVASPTARIIPLDSTEL